MPILKVKKNGLWEEIAGTSGSVNTEQITETIEQYLIDNPVQIEETDPTVPAWAKEAEKPKYTAEEVGAVRWKNGVITSDDGVGVLGWAQDGEYAPLAFVHPNGQVRTLVKHVNLNGVNILPGASGEIVLGNIYTPSNLKFGDGLQMDGDVLSAEVSKEDVDMVSEEVNTNISKLESQKLALPMSNGTPNHGTAGQFAVSDGNGGIMWKTLVEAEEVAY